MNNTVYIISALRTPMGSFSGSLSSVSATDLGSSVTKACIKHSNIPVSAIDEVFMGNVLQAGVGQAPARQVTIQSGLGAKTPSTTINKVCASGMKAVMLATQSIISGDNDIVIAGGMESMSNTPHYIPSRKGKKFGNISAEDGIIKDGLTDVYSGDLMGNCAELCADKYNISREEQDAFAIDSYNKSKQAWQNGKFNNEISPVTIPTRKGDIIVSEDEEYTNINLDKIPSLRPAFSKTGTITAANASTLNDGASCLILASEHAVKKYNLKPLAKILGYSDHAHEPEWFTTAPTEAVKKVLEKTNTNIKAIDFFELNEAFAVVGIANTQLLQIDKEKVNIYGGAVSLGHPLGNSGSRILVTLTNILNQEKGKLGIAGICNGGGGASAMLIERV